MNYFCDSKTYSTTGTKAITGLGFQPVGIRFTISQKLGTTENFVHFSTGFADGTAQFAHSMFQDASGSKTELFTNQCINHKVRDTSGNIIDGYKGTLVSFDPDGFTLNISAVLAGVPITFEAF